MSRDSELFKDRRCTDDPCGHSLSSCSHCRALVWYAPRATGHLCGVCARDVREGRPLGTGQRERYLDYQDSVAEQHRSRIDRHRQDVYYDVVTSRSGHPRSGVVVGLSEDAGGRSTIASGRRGHDVPQLTGRTAEALSAGADIPCREGGGGADRRRPRARRRRGRLGDSALHGERVPAPRASLLPAGCRRWTLRPFGMRL